MNSKKVLVGTILMGVLGMVLTGCGNKGTKEKGTSEFEPMVQLSYEAEQMTLQGNVKIVSDPRVDGFSGETYVDGFEDNGDACEFEVENQPDSCRWRSSRDGENRRGNLYGCCFKTDLYE